MPWVAAVAVFAHDLHPALGMDGDDVATLCLVEDRHLSTLSALSLALSWVTLNQPSEADDAALALLSHALADALGNHVDGACTTAAHRSQLSQALQKAEDEYGPHRIRLQDLRLHLLQCPSPNGVELPAALPVADVAASSDQDGRWTYRRPMVDGAS